MLGPVKDDCLGLSSVGGLTFSSDVAWGSRVCSASWGGGEAAVRHPAAGVCGGG